MFLREDYDMYIYITKTDLRLGKSKKISRHFGNYQVIWIGKPIVIVNINIHNNLSKLLNFPQMDFQLIWHED